MWIIDKFFDLFGDSMDKRKDDLTDNLETVRRILDKPDQAGDLKSRSEPVETVNVEIEEGRPLPAQGILKDMGYRVGFNGLLPHVEARHLAQSLPTPSYLERGLVRPTVG